MTGRHQKIQLSMLYCPREQDMVCPWKSSLQFAHLEHVWHHASGVSESVLVLQVEVNQLGVLGVVSNGTQVSGGEQLTLTCSSQATTIAVRVQILDTYRSFCSINMQHFPA